MPLIVDWSVSVNGIDCTARFNPYVMEIEVEDRDGAQSDAARIQLADDGRIILPAKGASLAVSILGVPVFRGTTEGSRSIGDKGSGGRLVISATGINPAGGEKEGRHFAMEDTSLEAYLQKFASVSGVSSIKVDPSLGGLQRRWWGPEGRDFLHEGRRLAKEYGATFKIQDGAAVFARQGSGLTPSGQSLATIEVRRPGNLIAWDIEPYTAREAHGEVRATWFDRDGSKFQEFTKGVPGAADSSAASVLRDKRDNEDDAKARAEGRATEIERQAGNGTVEIEINPAARVEGGCTVSGVRAGVDGSYRITGVTHTLTKGGARTQLELNQPGGSAGTDDRNAG